jgi:hypothetical protein
MTHIIQYLYDSNQLFEQDGMVPGDPSREAQEYMNDFGAVMRESLRSVVSSPGTGLYAPACIRHGVTWLAQTVGNMTFQQALGQWHRGKEIKIIDECDRPSCNPTCPMILLHSKARLAED